MSRTTGHTSTCCATAASSGSVAMPLGSRGGNVGAASLSARTSAASAGRWRSPRSPSAPLLAELARLPRLRPLLFALSPLPLASLAAGPLSSGPWRRRVAPATCWSRCHGSR